MSRSTARWIRWMLVDSSGSMKPPERPTATQLRCHCFTPRARAEAQDVGLGQRLAFDIAEQPFERRVLVEIAAAIDDAVADAVLQRNAPLPAGIMRHRPGVRHRGADALGLHRDRAIARQPVRPIVIADVQRACSISSARKPVQSRNRSPSIRSPHSSTSAAMSPLSPSSSTSAILPSTRFVPSRLGHLAQELGVERRNRAGTHSSCGRPAGARTCPRSAATSSRQ